MGADLEADAGVFATQVRTGFHLDTRPDDVSTVDTAAGRRMHDELLAAQPKGASHNADICPFCVDKATENTSTVPDPSRLRGPDVSEIQSVPNAHGGRDTQPMSDTKMISEETHQALLQKAVADATSATEKALETKTTEAETLKASLAQLESDNAGLKADVDRLNGELDTAQVSLKAANDKATQLEADIAAKDEAARKAETASKRAEQVKNLKLYDDEYVAERASAWAELADDDWASRLDEWAKLKPLKDAPASSDTAASAMSGSGDLTKEPVSTDTAAHTTKPSARRAVLGLS